MDLSDLARWELDLSPLVPLDGAPPFARASARSFNAEAEDVREALLMPIRTLLERGRTSPELVACLERTLAQLAFWRRVLSRVHAGAFAPARTCRDCLVRWMLA